MSPLPEAPFPVPSGRKVRGRVQVPPSKSVAHRALLLAALARGTSRVGPLPDAQDVQATRRVLAVLGVPLEEEGGGWVRVRGVGGPFSAPSKTLFCGASGTTLRLAAALSGAGEGLFRLDGEEQLRGRPLHDLKGPLESLGACVRFLEEEGHAPLEVLGRRWRGGEVVVFGETSSQFVSGILLGAPLAQGPLVVRARNLVSAPYAALTAKLMARFGVPVKRRGQAFGVRPTLYRAASVEVEPDASAAAFLFAAAAVTGGEVMVAGVGPGLLQGDARFPRFLAAMGVSVEAGAHGTTVRGLPRRGLDAEVQDVPDLVPPLVAVALRAPEPSLLRGVAHLRHKESDRIEVLSQGVAALGSRLEVLGTDLRVHPLRPRREAILDPHGDHRMAMAFTVTGLWVPGLRVQNPSCVAKSFPRFFETLLSLLG